MSSERPEFYEDFLNPDENDEPRRVPWLGPEHLACIVERGYAMPGESVDLCAALTELRAEIARLHDEGHIKDELREMEEPR